MAKVVNDSKRRPVVREFARRLVQHLPGKDRIAEIKAAFYFVRDEVRYIRDIRGVETLHTPEKILQTMAGDCDDKALLIAALLESIGFQCRFIGVGFTAGHISHVFTQVMNNGKWINLETTEAWPMGSSPPGIKDFILQVI